LKIEEKNKRRDMPSKQVERINF